MTIPTFKSREEAEAARSAAWTAFESNKAAFYEAFAAESLADEHLREGGPVYWSFDSSTMSDVVRASEAIQVTLKARDEANEIILAAERYLSGDVVECRQRSDLEGRNVTAVFREPHQHGQAKIKSLSGSCGAITDEFVVIHDVVRIIDVNDVEITKEPGVVGMVGRMTLVRTKEIGLLFAEDDVSEAVARFYPPSRA